MDVLLRYGRGVFDQKWVRCKEVGEKIQKGRERLLIGNKGEGRGGEGEEVSHLLFAGGLKINLGKSELIPIGGVDFVQELISELGCKEGKLPSIYLGLPLGATFRLVAI
ncbi:hypothetical protein CK203_012875 [Vitis vinifera]|uniref:Reverse transcriptase domain-containing protein n=1 Tax=Vitis vinifera TaxID=29760 RepID=A0A438JLF6_VITVI|nr:hypothetical protein CK203_012875 [Vitis vinifera]